MICINIQILPDKRKRKYCLRNIFNAVLWICRTGCQWRNLSSYFPYWQIVYYYFNKWKKNGFFEEVMRKVVRKERMRQGRNYSPSVAAISTGKPLQYYYYKCRTAGCNCNKRTERVNHDFEKFLSDYQIIPHLVAPLLFHMNHAFDNHFAAAYQTRKNLKEKLAVR